MNLVVYTDGSQAAEEAVKYAARRCLPESHVWLLHVVPSARQGEMENGKKVLDRSLEVFTSFTTCASPVDTRLEVGDAASRITAVAEAINADAIIMGSHGLGAFPRSQVLGQAAENTVAATDRPVILVFPKGTEVVPAASIGA